MAFMRHDIGHHVRIALDQVLGRLHRMTEMHALVRLAMHQMQHQRG